MLGHDADPSLIAQRTLNGPGADEWLANVVDRKHLPFEMTASYMQWSSFSATPIDHAPNGAPGSILDAPGSSQRAQVFACGRFGHIIAPTPPEPQPRPHPPQGFLGPIRWMKRPAMRPVGEARLKQQLTMNIAEQIKPSTLAATARMGRAFRFIGCFGSSGACA